MSIRTIGLSAAILAIAASAALPASAATSSPKPHATMASHGMKKKPAVLKAIAPSHPGSMGAVKGTPLPK